MKIFTFKMAALLAALLTLNSLTPVQAQINRDNPLGGVKTLIKQQEVVLTYTELPANAPRPNRMNTLIFRTDAGGQQLNPIESYTSTTQSTGPFNPASTSLVSGNFIGEEFGEVVFTLYHGLEGTSGSVCVSSTLTDEFGNTPRTIDPRNTVTVYGQMYPAGNLIPRVSGVAGNFDQDELDELAIVYHGVNGTLMVETFDIRPNQGIVDRVLADPKQTITGATFDTDNDQAPKTLAATAVDFDLDGIDDLAIAYEAPGDDLRVDIYGVDSTNQLVLKHSNVLVDAGFDYCTQSYQSYNMSNLSLDITAGDFEDLFYGEELAIVAHYGLKPGIGSAGTNEGLYLFALREEADRSALILPNRCVATGGNQFYTNDQYLLRDDAIALAIASGDVDGDLEDEIVISAGPDVRVFEVSPNGNTQLSLSQKTSFSLTTPNNEVVPAGEAFYADNLLAVGNIDALDGNFQDKFRAEILVGRNFPTRPNPSQNDVRQEFELTVYGFEVPNGGTAIDFSTPVVRSQLSLADTTDEVLGVRHFSVAMADVDGGSVKLGTPNRTSFTEVFDPLIILNAPPTHFDRFGNQSYDLNNLYNTGDPSPPASINHFQAVYQQITDSALSFSTEFNTDWALSTSVDAGFAASGFSLGGKFSNTYGEGFTEVNESTRSIVITEQRTAIRDDELLAYLIDYSLFEYPVFKLGSNTPLTHVVVVVPGDIRRSFVGVRSPDHNYVHDHEHGNLFSYPTDVSELNRAPNAQGTYSFTSQQISKTSGFGSVFAISQTDATSNSVANSVSNQTSVGLSAGGAFKGFGLSASIEGTYNRSELTTKTSTYREQVNMSGDLGQGEDLNIPSDYSYSITPITYWNERGSLVLDYLVDISETGFWLDNYDSYDPAFMYFDQHRVEKELENPATYKYALRYLSREIQFESTPVPGESTLIQARIHNFALRETPQGVGIDVAFYYLDPSQGDTLVPIGTVNTSRSMLGRESARDIALLELPWNVPGNLGPDTKVVGIIDPENDLPDEIHDYPNGNGISNNVAWTCAFVPNCAIPTDASPFFPDNATNVQDFEMAKAAVMAFPNPFHQHLTLALDLPQAAEVEILVTDLQGRVIYQPARSIRAQGASHEIIQTQDWSPGLYLYQVRIGDQLSYGKVMLRP